jgi:hypothetical protein
MRYPDSGGHRGLAQSECLIIGSVENDIVSCRKPSHVVTERRAGLTAIAELQQHFTPFLDQFEKAISGSLVAFGDLKPDFDEILLST